MPCQVQTLSTKVKADSDGLFYLKLIKCVTLSVSGRNRCHTNGKSTNVGFVLFPSRRDGETVKDSVKRHRKTKKLKNEKLEVRVLRIHVQLSGLMTTIPSNFSFGHTEKFITELHRP